MPNPNGGLFSTLLSLYFIPELRVLSTRFCAESKPPFGLAGLFSRWNKSWGEREKTMAEQIRSKTMKKLLTFTAVGVLLTAPAVAVQKCIKFDDNAVGSAGHSKSYDYEGFPHGFGSWTTTFPDIGVVWGFGMCSNLPPATADSYSELEFRDGNNDSCWCKMVSPLVSDWISAGDFTTQDQCYAECADRCSYYVAGDGYYDTKVTMFGNAINRLGQ